MVPRVYFDHAATTPLDPRVAEAMRPWLGERVGNPSSLHREGREAREAVESARASVASLVGAEPSEVVFAGSGTEADNLAVFGVVDPAKASGVHILASSIEHPAVLEPCRQLAREGAELELVPIGSHGLVDPDSVACRLRPNTRLVSIMAASNVVGTIQPIAEIGAICRARGVTFHVDAVQAAGKIPLDLRRLPIDLLSLSAHKIHGPQGVGALVLRNGVRLSPLVRGGGQERGLRSGTENVAGIVGFGVAARLATESLADDNVRLVELRERLASGIATQLPSARLLGHPSRRLPGHLCLLLDGQEGEAIRLLLALDEEGFAVSTGSACSSAHAAEPSYVLLALGFDPIRARGALRLSLGRGNTSAEVDRFLDLFPRLARSLRPVTSRPFFASMSDPGR
jgi:cysteine desulfurase